VSRSGPTFAVEPAALKVWQLPQGLAVKTAFPVAAFPAAGGEGVVLAGVVVFAVRVGADAAATVRVTVRVPPV